MPRPRIHDLEQLMDAAERLAVESGASAVTVRALSEATNVSNGAIYHAFGSRAGLVGRVWLRAAQRFLDLQREAVEQAFRLGENPQASAVDAVVAAADSPARFLLEFPVAGRFLLTVRRDELLGASEIPDEIAVDLRMLDRTLVELFVRLSRALWDRSDREAVAVVRDCVVELPAALLLRGRRTPDPAVRERLAAAVRAVVTLPPPTRTPREKEPK
ncbi:TetR/AcrR family transcriptional regulator [Skermania sp. ID1734]|uniref:TetR/AcrR family transcriptional regulator n=1 Tax=Skermania sp. ID1734 TaxID=2597516 RepID=UPI00117D1BC8|nr:TetR/AcrR family transcriptional regulator [Skermania sp. ID1734]TSE01582.1 TetR/AcrR family transcriptional regulator [Skermania sp. ID1734]